MPGFVQYIHWTYWVSPCQWLVLVYSTFRGHSSRRETGHKREKEDGTQKLHVVPKVCGVSCGALGRRLRLYVQKTMGRRLGVVVGRVSRSRMYVLDLKSPPAPSALRTEGACVRCPVSVIKATLSKTRSVNKPIPEY